MVLPITLGGSYGRQSAFSFRPGEVDDLQPSALGKALRVERINFLGGTLAVNALPLYLANLAAIVCSSAFVLLLAGFRSPLRRSRARAPKSSTVSNFEDGYVLTVSQVDLVSFLVADECLAND